MKADEAVAVADVLDSIAGRESCLELETRDTLRAAAIWIRSTANQFLELQHDRNRLAGPGDREPIPGSLAEDTSQFWVR